MTVGIQRLMWAIERVGDAFDDAVFAGRDADAAMAVVEDGCVLEHVPAGTGGRGADGVRRHLVEDVLPHLPDDLVLRRVSRTVDQRRVVTERAVSFTHDRELPWLLPGAGPTGRTALVMAVSVVTFRHTSRLGTVDSRIAAHRTLWDHTGLVAQLRLGPVFHVEHAARPVTSPEQAAPRPP